MYAVTDVTALNLAACSGPVLTQAIGSCMSCSVSGCMHSLLYDRCSCKIWQQSLCSGVIWLSRPAQLWYSSVCSGSSHLATQEVMLCAATEV